MALSIWLWNAVCPQFLDEITFSAFTADNEELVLVGPIDLTCNLTDQCTDIRTSWKIRAQITFFTLGNKGQI